MTTAALPIIWCILQVSLLCLVGGSLYLVARRFDPRLGRTCVAVLLTLVAALSVTALSPWPSWLLSTSAPQTQLAPAGLRADPRLSTASRVAESTTLAGELAPSQEGLLSGVFWHALWDELKRPEAPRAVRAVAAGARAWHWSAAVLVLVALAATIGALRMLAAWLALRSWKLTSAAIDAPQLDRIARRLEREMHIGQTVELREARAIQSAATMGWRRPIILLPKAWREWPEEELRAVVAHELAHVRARDWPTWLFAQVAVTLHFYHPLVHWLARRLRLEQELAADAAAAAVTGSKDAYLGALASQMLRADNARLTWAAQTFLPTRSTIVRRIEMLRAKSPKMLSGALPGWTRATMVSAILAVGLVVAGFRGPGGGTSTELGAQEPVPPKPLLGQTPPASSQVQANVGDWDVTDWSSMSVYAHFAESDAVFLLVVQPRAIFASDEMAPLRAQINQLLAENNRELAGLQIEELVTVAFSPYERASDGLGTVRAMLSFDKQVATSSFQPQWAKFQEVEKIGSYVLRSLSGAPHGYAAMVIGEQRIVFDDYEGLKSLATRLASDQLRRPQWLEDAPRPREDSAAWLALNMDFVRRESAKIPANQQQNVPIALIKPLIEKPRAVSFTAASAPSLEVSGVAVCNSEADAAQVASTAQAIVTLARNMLAEQLRAAPPEGTPQAMIVGTITMADKFLQSAKFGTVGNEAHVTFAGGSLGQQLMQMGIVLPAIQSAREAARRTQGMNNLKQLALAMLVYADVHGHFPPAAIKGPNGDLHSWRVAVLPYLEQDALYDQYRLTEPWDSEHNKKLIAKMPAVFRSPMESATSINSSYYVLVGEETIFDPTGEGARMQDITDGTSNTIILAEAKRDIPWTKPDDVAYSPEQPLPTLGGYHEGIFSVAFADGSVHVFNQQTDQEALRRMIEKADGLPVER